jgi:decaprenylphospho-beta-D-ribofuranose 2-oxidase
VQDTNKQENMMNWSMTELSPCHVFKARDLAGIHYALATARADGLPVIPHGAGHSYTDAALNTGGMIIDVTGMNRILSWDAHQGIMQVEPGVTMHDLVQVAQSDHWWPAVTPSTADATIGGCIAMNVNGKNAWKCGSFGEHVLSITILLANGQELTISPESDPQLFRAVVGSAGLLGIITSITLQLQRIPSGSVDVRMQPAASIGEILTILQEEQSADYLEAWVDGIASGCQLGRGIVTCTTYNVAKDAAYPGTRMAGHPQGVYLPSTRLCQTTQRQKGRDIPCGCPAPPSRLRLLVFQLLDQFKAQSARCIGTIIHPVVESGVHFASSMMYWWCKWWGKNIMLRRSLFQSTYYSPAMYTGYRTLLPHGTETFQAFVPFSHAEPLFEEILRRSHENHFMPLWCIIKLHRQDPFLLSYQVDGFSLEVNYQVVPQTHQRLRKMLWELMNQVIGAGGKFYLAKDSLLTNILYRRSIGDDAVDTFLQLKEVYDPEMLFQSDLFRRVFQDAYCEIVPDVDSQGEELPGRWPASPQPFVNASQSVRRTCG